MNPSTSLLMHLKLHEAHQKHVASHIHYTIHGPDHMTDTTMTYILIHGNRSSMLYWELFQKELHALKDVRTVTVDLRGFGRSNHIEKVNSIDDFADDVHKIVLEVAAHEEQSVEQIRTRYILVGWSLGAVVALTMAAKHQQYYQRMVLVAPAPISGYPYMQVDENGKTTDIQCTTREQVEGLPQHILAIKQIQEKDLTFFKSLCNARWFNVGQKPSDEYIELLLKQCCLQTNFLDVVWILHTYNLIQMVKDKIVGKVLIIHGKQDLIVPIKYSYEILETLGSERCELIEVENLGHMPPLSIPKELAIDILRFAEQK